MPLKIGVDGYHVIDMQLGAGFQQKGEVEVRASIVWEAYDLMKLSDMIE